MSSVKSIIAWGLWPLALVCVGLISLRLGAAGGSWFDVWQSFEGLGHGQADLIATYRLPRALAGAVVGVHFAIAGLIMQIVLRNPLADPTIFGISGGASLAVVGAMSLSLAMFPASQTISVSTDYLPLAIVPHIALAGGLLATLIVFWLSWEGGLSVNRMILTGVIFGALLNAIVMALVLSLSEARTELAILWLAGSLYARNLSHLWPAIPWTVVGIVATIFLTRELSALRFDRQTAQSLGVRLGWVQPALIIVATGLAASAVSVAGPVGFVGLLAPHIVRRFGVQSLAFQIWSCAFVGAILVVFGDTLGRIIVIPLEVPVGIVTSLIGAPVFAFILSRSARRS